MKLHSYTDLITNSSSTIFTIKNVTYEEVQKFLKKNKIDCLDCYEEEGPEGELTGEASVNFYSYSSDEDKLEAMYKLAKKFDMILKDY